VGEVEGSEPPVEAVRGEEARPGMADRAEAVAGHGPAADVRDAEEPHEHGAHARAREVERHVEAHRAQLVDDVADEAVRVEEPLAALEHERAEPVEVDAVQTVDAGDALADGGEVSL